MNSTVQRFLDSLTTAADIDAAYQATCNEEQSRCADALSSYARTCGFEFAATDANAWLDRFVLSIADSDLRSRYRMARLRHINDWAAFLALDRELKIELPEQEYIGNQWLLEPDEQPIGGKQQRTRYFSRWFD